MEILQNSTFSLMGIWVAVSCLSGLLVYLLITVFDFLYPKQSSYDRYHKNIAGLVFFFLINIAGTYLFNDNINIKNENITYQEIESVNELPFKSSYTNSSHESKSEIETKQGDFITSNLIFKTLGIFWLVGAIAFTLKLIGGYFYTQTLILDSQKEIPKKWKQFIDKQTEKLRIERRVKIFESLKITSAFTFGFVKPVIALPLGFFTTLPAEQIEAVLLHELYHIKHKDYLVNLLTMTFEVLFFYHPLMWWLAKSIRVERENRCDDQVTQIADKQVYAHALLNMESYRQSMNYAIPFSNKQSNLKMRIMRIFEQKPEQNIGLKPFLSLLMIVVFLMGFTFFKLEEPNKKAEQGRTTENQPKLADKLATQETEDKILFKSENSRLGLVLEMTKNTLIAKTENANVKLYLDEKLYPLNQKIPFGQKDIASMYENEENEAYHFFTRDYFKSNSKANWEKENENRNTYVFDRKTEFFTFRPAKDLASEIEKDSNEKIEEMTVNNAHDSSSISKIENKPANSSSFEIHGPIVFSSENRDSKLIDTTNLKLLKKLVKNHGSEDNDDVQFKIDGELLSDDTEIVKALGNREIKKIKIISPSEDAESGLIEITTYKVVKKRKVKSNAEKITISVLYDTLKSDKPKIVEMNAEKENVLEALGVHQSEILFVVDGVEKKLGYKPRNDINPNKIDSISVLKDKKATDKYGKKAKNGVVEIYLKKE